MTEGYSRRRFLALGGLMGGSVLGSCLVAKPLLMAETGDKTWPWPYRELDLREVEERGYRSGYAGGCMFGAFDAIVGLMGDRYGEPCSSFPVDMMRYGGGGVGGMGTVCGALNGASAAIGLFVADKPVQRAMILELFLWHERTELPLMKVDKPVHDLPMPKSVAGSPLCHVSLTRWCDKTGYKVGTPAHMERCHLLTGDVAGKAADLLNRNAKGQFQPALALSADVRGCLACHGVGGQEADTVAKMECRTCHQDPHKAK